MSTSPRIETREEQHYSAIPITATLAEWDQVNALIPEVLGIMGEDDLTPDGPLFYRYLVATDLASPFTVDVGFPTEHFATCKGRAHSGTIPAGRYAALRHGGHPDGLRDSFAVLDAWLAERGEEPDSQMTDGQRHWAGRFEFYLTDPKEQPNPNKWEIDLAWKLRDTD